MTQRFKVVITDFINGVPETENKVLGDIAEIIPLDASSENELLGKVEDADALMIYHNILLSRNVIERLRKCKLIVRCGVGFDNVDHRFARERNIPVANVPDYGTEEVADSAIGLMLSMTRGISQLNSILRADPAVSWAYTHAAPIYRLRDRVFGVVGLGRIGTAAALRAKAIGMDVVFYDPLKPDGYDKALGLRRADSLDALLEQSFVVSLHCPLTPDTKNLIDAVAIAKMPRGSFLVNTARGAVVDPAAIPDAIASGRLAGAAIDVLPQEPPNPEDPFIRAWRDPRHPAHHRVIVNPHSAFYAVEGLLDMRIKGSQACRKALLGQRLLNVVN